MKEEIKRIKKETSRKQKKRNGTIVERIKIWLMPSRASIQ